MENDDTTDGIALEEIDIPAEWERYMSEHGNYGRYYGSTRNAFLLTVEARLADADEIERIGWCVNCSNPDRDDNMNAVSGGELVCASCFSGYVQCEDCEEFVSYTNTTMNDCEICSECLSNNWLFCSECDGYYPDGDRDEHEHDDSCRCESPSEAREFYVRNDGHEPLKNDTSATVSLPAGIISAEGMNQIARYLANFYYDRDTFPNMSDRDSMYSLARGLENNIGTTWQTKEGNFTKRLSRFAYKKHALKLSPAIISKIGCIASDNSQAANFTIQTTRDLNMSAADFYHEDSCWWQSYSESRCSLKSNGGFGLRSFSDTDAYNVTGRAWIMPMRIDPADPAGKNLIPTFETMTPDAFVVFNGYGAMSGYAPARILSHMAGMTYRKITFTCAPMYVNGDIGYLVAPEEIASRYTDGSLRINAQIHSDLYETEHTTTTQEN